MIKVLIADDHPVVRKGLKQILEETSDICVTGEASTQQEVLDHVWENDYDVILLDISMPGGSGLDVLKELKKTKPDIRILVLSIYPEDQYAVRVFRAGGSGYLSKDSAAEELVAAIRKIAIGGKYVRPSVAEKLAFDIETDHGQFPHEKLSDREFQVLCFLGKGKQVKEIAECMHLSVKTISTYRTRILAKMNMKNNSELTYYAIKHHLVD